MTEQYEKELREALAHYDDEMNGPDPCKTETIFKAAQTLADILPKIREAKQEYQWLKDTAENDKDYARVIGYGDCLGLFANNITKIAERIGGDDVTG